MKAALIGVIGAGVVVGCTASGGPTAVRPSQMPPATAVGPAAASATPGSAQPSATPSPGSAAEWDQKLNEAFGPMDPAFAIRSPEPLSTPGTGASPAATP